MAKNNDNSDDIVFIVPGEELPATAAAGARNGAIIDDA